MEYFERTLRLAKEFLLFKKYKQLHPVLAVLVGILMIPWAVMFGVALAWTFVISLFFTFVEVPVKFLHRLVREETKESHVAFKIVLYYLSWPIIFLLYVFYAFMIVEIYVIYFFTMCLGFIASLGGYRFHVTPLQEDISIETHGKHNVMAIIHVAFALLWIFVGLILVIVGAVFAAQEEPGLAALMFAGFGFIYAPFIIEALYAILGYWDWKKAPKEEKAKELEAPKAE